VDPIQVCFTLCSRDQRIKCVQDGCKVFMDSYMASNWPCFMVTWPLPKNHLLEVARSNTKPGDHIWHSKISQPLIRHMYHMRGPRVHRDICWDSTWLGAWSHMTSHYSTWGPVTTPHDFGGVLGRHLDTFIRALTFIGHGSWFVCEVALSFGFRP
jgi:hypothetical protein